MNEKLFRSDSLFYQGINILYLFSYTLKLKLPILGCHSLPITFLLFTALFRQWHIKTRTIQSHNNKHGKLTKTPPREYNKLEH